MSDRIVNMYTGVKTNIVFRANEELDTIEAKKDQELTKVKERDITITYTIRYPYHNIWQQ